ncbi:RICIN domain-containing protein [Streptomyces corynorhini]|uniref:Ricin-type beta-trefoil lectin domain protein n=1 Tax=Streptomyces corynorhini TaxID=2282652 RepID=A0A370BBC2_9ACTN|nr:RICIN domain-containing protein [Streptomyces corynorhini]RDG39090.1 ricin-type beta-trefoil lectin domain protein [Streptomyces corynorhini]
MKRPRTFRYPAAALAVALATGGVLAGGPQAGAAAPAATTTVTVRPDPSYQGQEFEGWGTSLVWFAHATGGYPAEIRERLAKLVFGDDGLALNIARYNIGGGNAPDVKDYLRAGGAVEGWWRAPEGTTRDDRDWWSAGNPAHWNANADATQRWWVNRIKKDVTHWEAFSNSPPWFMTESGYVSGNFQAGQDQLRPDKVADFAAYLTGAVERLEKASRIKVDTVDPFNEPNTSYWGTTLGPDGEPVGGRQEGAHVGPERQQQVIRALAEKLGKSKTDAVISAMDETNPTTFARNWESYPRDVRDLVAQLNVHTYGTGGRTTARDIAKGADKPLWMSEVDGDWGDGQDFTSMRPGLGLARHIVDDLRELEPTAWLFWQPVEDYDNMRPGGESAKGGNWGSIQVPFSCTAKDTLKTCPVLTNTKFDTARNFTHFIRPGDRLVRVDDTASAAAVSASGREATVVHVNDTDSAHEIALDLSGFAEVAKGAKVTPVVTDASGALVKKRAVAVSKGRASVTVPAGSVTTLRITGVSGVAKDTAPIRPGHTYGLTGVGSGKSLGVSDDATGAVIRTTDAGDAGQRWRIEKVTKGVGDRERYVLRNPADGSRLAVDGGTAVLERDQAKPGRGAQWILSTTGDGSYTFVSAVSGELLEVAGQSSAEGARVSVWKPNSGTNQRWQVTGLT